MIFVLRCCCGVWCGRTRVMYSGVALLLMCGFWSLKDGTKKCTAQISLGDHHTSTAAYLHNLRRRIGTGGFEHLGTTIGRRECGTLPSSRHACCSTAHCCEENRMKMFQHGNARLGFGSIRRRYMTRAVDKTGQPLMPGFFSWVGYPCTRHGD